MHFMAALRPPFDVPAKSTIDYLSRWD